MKNGVCPKCGCTIVIQGARVLDRQSDGSARDLSVAVYAKPEVSEGEVTGGLWACVCGACGYTELYATNLDAMVRAAVEGQSRPKDEA